MDFDSLPLEMQCHIFSFLTQRELREKAAIVNRKWQQLSTQSFVQRQVQIHCYFQSEDVELLQACCKINHLILFLIDDWTLLNMAPKRQCLRKLEFSSCRFSSCDDEINKFAEKFPSIHTLKLKYCEINNNECIKPTTCLNWKLLKYLHLDNHEKKTNCECVKFFAENCQCLEHVKIKYPSTISEDSFTSLLNLHHSSLRSLSLRCESLPTASYLLLRKCSNLTYLKLHFACNMPDEDLLPLKRLENLEVLVLTGIYCITTQGFKNFFEAGVKFNHLRKLCIGWYDNFTDECLYLMAKSCPNLKKFSLVDVEITTDIGIQSVVDNCRLLKSLFFVNMCNLEGKFMVGISSKLPQLAYVEFRYCQRLNKKYLSEEESNNPGMLVQYDHHIIDNRKYFIEHFLMFTGFILFTCHLAHMGK